MPKINYEEYEVLKSLDDKWKWISRDKNKTLWVYEAKPDKGEWRMWEMSDNRVKRIIDDNLFEFVQWGDEEPYNIQELIEQYEDSKEYTDSLMIKHFIDKANESEGTEVKDKKWLQDSITRAIQELFSTPEPNYFDFEKTNKRMRELVNQLDEPEVLSQELPVVPMWFDEWWKDVTKGESNLFQNIERFHDELFNSGTSKMFNYIISPGNKKKLLNIIINELEYVVEEEQKYNVNFKVKSSSGTVGIFLYKMGDEVLAGDNFRAYSPKEDKYRLTEQEIRDFQNGDVLFEHFAVKVEELEE